MLLAFRLGSLYVNFGFVIPCLVKLGDGGSELVRYGSVLKCSTILLTYLFVYFYVGQASGLHEALSACYDCRGLT